MLCLPIGTSFTEETDHAPLLPMFNNPSSRPPMRIERWLTYLQQFSFKLVYRPGVQNGADHLSRHPVPATHDDMQSSKWREQTVCALISDTIPKAITLAELQDETGKDEFLQTLIPIIEKSNRMACKDKVEKFYSIFPELSFTNGLVLRGSRIVLPQKLQKRAVNICHEGHMGIVKTKQLLRSKVWFHGIDKLVESIQLCSNAYHAKCLPFQVYTNSKHRELLQMSSTPDGPWLEVSADFCGPFPDGSLMFVAIVQIIPR